MLVYLLGLLAIGQLAAANFAVTISPSTPLVAIQNGTFSPAKSQIECSSGQRHLYCCWSSPQLSDCRKCDEKDCPIDGVSVSSDQQKCTVSILHQNANNAGTWTCQLYAMSEMAMVPANASTQLFVVNINEVPLIRQTQPSTSIEFFEASDTKEAQFDCVSPTKAPLEEYQWYFKDQPLSSTSQVKINLTRSDFNGSLTCIVDKKLNPREKIGVVTASKHLVMEMNPIILDILKIRENNFEIQVESWPMPSFVRLSLKENCDSNCIIYKWVQNKYVLDKSPYNSGKSFIEEVTIKGQVYGAKTRINLVLNQDQLQNAKDLFVGIGNDLNVANVKIDLLQNVPHGYHLTSDSQSLKENKTTYIVVGVSLALALLVTLVILLAVFRQRISEFFKCGTYLVPPTEDECHEEDAEAKWSKEEKNGSGQPPLISPETTEF